MTDRSALKDGEIEITPEMVCAGEEVIERALLGAGLPLSWLVLSSVRDVYIAMSRKSDRQRFVKDHQL